MIQSIRGYFKSYFPIIDLDINNYKISLIIDTGFNGEIMLPRKIIELLDLVQIGFITYRTVDGRTTIAKLYTALIKLINEVIRVPIVETNSKFSLAGIKLFEDCKIILEKNKNMVEIFSDKSSHL